MKKIPTIYIRDPTNPRHVTNTVHPDCQWVLDGQGIATRKLDGTCVMLDQNWEWWARREVKPDKDPPRKWIPVDQDTRRVGWEPFGWQPIGWEPIDCSPFKAFHAEAAGTKYWRAGTYELCGPRINRNPERFDGHELILHGSEIITIPGTVAPTPHALLEVCRTHGWEGVVWHHPDGRRAKLKVRDYPVQSP